MLFTALGVSMAFAVPITTSEITFYQTENVLLTQADNVGFAPRASPMAEANVAITEVPLMYRKFAIVIPIRCFARYRIGKVYAVSPLWCDHVI